jgi:protein SCO1
MRVNGLSLTLCVVLIMVAAALLLPLAGCSRRGGELPTYNTVPDFTLISQTGEPFHGRDLTGRVWIADFFFTSCDGPCPRMATQMQKLQAELKNYPDIRLVSFSVDPERDTPEVIGRYARRLQADPERWHLLTGEQRVLHQLGRETFMLNNVDGSLAHSTRFALVDRQGVVRAYYITEERDALQRIVRDALALAAGS